MARALQEGRAEIMLSNHISAASIVGISKVKGATIEETSRNKMLINTDEQAGQDIRIKLKLYLGGDAP